MQNYLIDPLWSGEMLSKELQKKRIKNSCRGKKERRKKMLAYIRKCNKENAEPIDRSERILEHFAKIKLSPIYTSDSFGGIPSFSDLFRELCNEQMERSLKLHEKTI